MHYWLKNRIDDALKDQGLQYNPETKEIESINEELETAIEDLSYTRDRLILTELNHFPIIAVHAHTRPFQRKWLNVVTGLFVPTGIFFYIRMIRFRLRLYKDLRVIRQTSERIIPRALELAAVGQ